MPGRRPPRPPQTFACGRRATLRRAIEARAIADGQPALASVLERVYGRLRDRVWTVAELAGLGLIEPAETRAMGFLLARHAGQTLGGLLVCRLSASREGRLWCVRPAEVVIRGTAGLSRPAPAASNR